MPLTVLSIAYPFAPVSPNAVGGSERILSDLDHALVSAGHTSLVIACEGSQTAGELFTSPLPYELADPDHRYREQFQAAINRALSSQRIDLIHMHGLDAYAYEVPDDLPVLVTLHMPISWYSNELWAMVRDNVQFHCVSETQRLSCPPELRDIPVVVNGVDLVPIEEKSNFAIALGRICPEKNLHQALEAGSMVSMPVLLGGQVFPYKAHRQYFHEKIEPLLRNNRVGHTFLGPLSTQQKHHLLAQAKCLLHPTLAPESSSLVAMESLAAGTPVLAYPSGALPEIIEDGMTGFLVENVKEMAAAIRKIHTIDPQNCRRTAEQRFSKKRMIEDYLRLYNTLLAKTQGERLYACQG